MVFVNAADTGLDTFNLVGKQLIKILWKTSLAFKGFIREIIMEKEKHSKKTGIFLSAYDLVFYFRTKIHLKLYRGGKEKKKKTENERQKIRWKRKNRFLRTHCLIFRT